MPIFNGAAILNRAIPSMLRQDFPAWELIAIDDGSTDDSYEHLQAWAERDRRIRPLQMSVNGGPAAARNAGLRHATGPVVAYLDCDDEYHPDYLGHVARHGDRADVLVSGYDIVRDDPGPGPSIVAWDPAPLHDHLFTRNVATPLGVAHRRDLAGRVGGFDERLRFEEDWDLWKRFARAGASFLYLPFKSGVYHVREGSLSRSRRNPGNPPANTDAASEVPFMTVITAHPR